MEKIEGLVVDGLVVAFTGHRPNKLGGYNTPNPTYNDVCDAIEKLLEELRPKMAISGMALGVDQWAAEICIELDIPFIAAVPFAGQGSRWPLESHVRYLDLLKAAKGVQEVCDPGYAAWKMQKRNEWMVDNCDVLIAVWDGLPSGGTYNCVEYAKQVGKEIRRISPQPRWSVVKDA